MQIGIYGSGGYLGSLIASSKEFEEEVVKLGRDDSPSTERVIDCGFPRNYSNAEVLSQYFETIANRLERVKFCSGRYVYLASMSSLSRHPSNYGLAKSTAESLVQASGGTLLRLGLVIDFDAPGGRFAQLARLVASVPIVPIPHRSRFRLLVTPASAVGPAATLAFEDPQSAQMIIQEASHWTTLGDLLYEIAGVIGVRTLQMPLWATRSLEVTSRHLKLGWLDNLSSLAE